MKAIPSKKLIQAYKEIANFTKELCEKHCITRDTHIGGCCDKLYCEIALERASKYGIELEVNGSPTFLIGENGCTAEPWLRPLCSMHVCDRCIYTNVKDYNKYFKLRAKADKLDWEECDGE